GTRCARSNCCATTCTSPTRRSSPGLPPRSCRSDRSTTASSGIPERSRGSCRRPTSPPCTDRSSNTETGSNMSDRDAANDRKKIEVYDTTLRDGSQLEGISLTVDDKLRIAEQLDWLGVDFIEAGWPGANPKDDEM